MLDPNEFANTVSAAANYAGNQMGAKAGIQNAIGKPKPQRQQSGAGMAKKAAESQGVRAGGSAAEFAGGAAEGGAAAAGAGGAGMLAELAPLALV